MTLTRAQIRAELYSRIPGLGFTGTADSVATTGIVDAYAMADTTLGANHFRGSYIYRPSLSTDDVVKKAGDLVAETGTLRHKGTSYADIATLSYEIVGPMHPDELNACIRRALQRIYQDVQVVLPGLVVDGDMEATGTTNWTTTSNATVSKVTDTTKVWSGSQALQVEASANGGFAQSDEFRVSPNTHYYASAVLRVASSDDVTFNVWDGGSLSAVTYSDQNWVHVWTVGQTGSTTETASIRIVLTNLSDVVYIDHMCFYPLDSLLLPAPSWLNEQYKFLKLREARYGKSLTNSASVGGMNIAGSRTWHDWIQPSMFSLDPFHGDVHPYIVNLQRPIPQNELWIQGKRPFSDLDDLSTEAATTYAPARLVYAYAADEVLKVLTARYPSETRWASLFAQNKEEINAETQSRPETPLQLIRREHYGRI